MLIFSLAKETGWSEQTLLWEIPCHRVNHYWHACLRSHDIWTVSVSAPVEESLLALEEMLGITPAQDAIPDLF